MKINGRNIEALPISIKRNASYLKSVRLGLRAGVYWAPTTLYNLVRFPLLAALTGTVLTLAGLSVWALSRAAIVVAGFLGYLTEQPSKQ